MHVCYGGFGVRGGGVDDVGCSAVGHDLWSVSIRIRYDGEKLGNGYIVCS